ncbi:MAG: hypothetical protein HXS52_00800 [Theionarchaea archaeon]|nr:hypothetical protein [Theionarchaea archaeon]
MKTDSIVNAANLARVATVPLIIVPLLWASATGFIGDIVYRDFALSKETLGSNLIVGVPIIAIAIGVWLPHRKLFLYLGRIGTAVWLFPFGFFSFMVLGEPEHAEPIVFIIFLVLFLSTVSVIWFLWNLSKKEKEHENNL